MTTAPTVLARRRTRLLSRLLARPLLWRMMLRQGIDPAERWWHGMERLVERIVTRCQSCAHVAECRSWLASASARSTPPEFCRNRRTLTSCRILAGDHAQQRRGGGTEPEPSLPEITGDPIVQRLMAADGIETRDVRQALDNAAQRSGATPSEDDMRILDPTSPDSEPRSGLARMRSRPLLWRMMAQLGLDPHGRWWHGAENTLSGVVARCTSCRHTEVCGTWLDNAAEGSSPPGFCPNARVFATCRPAPPPSNPQPEPTDYLALRQALAKALQIKSDATARTSLGESNRVQGQR